MTFPPIRRVVTGHDDKGRAIVASNGALPKVVELDAAPGVIFYEVDNGADPTTGPLVLPPPRHGTRFRFVDFPPETEDLLAADAGAAFAEIGDADAATGEGAPHPFMHRTETVDYGVVIEGEMTLVLDEADVSLSPGSVVIQRGTNHAWANRSGAMCRMLFVLIDGAYADDLPKG